MPVIDCPLEYLVLTVRVYEVAWAYAGMAEAMKHETMATIIAKMQVRPRNRAAPLDCRNLPDAANAMMWFFQTLSIGDANYI